MSRVTPVRALVAAAVCIVLAAPATAPAQYESIYGRDRTDPTAMKMGLDLLLARPVLFAFTVVGTVLYVISWPFSAVGGNADEACEVLVKGPARATFVRCLGCATSDQAEANTR